MTFAAGKGWFNYRVGAILLRDGCVLMAHNSRDPYYYSLGGRVQFGESAEEAVRREVVEELGTAPQTQRLGFIYEVFFPLIDSGGAPCHELNLFYYITMPADWDLDSRHQSMSDGLVGDDKSAEWFEWLPLDRLHTVRAYPWWFATELVGTYDGIRHLVTRE